MKMNAHAKVGSKAFGDVRARRQDRDASQGRWRLPPRRSTPT